MSYSIYHRQFSSQHYTYIRIYSHCNLQRLSNIGLKEATYTKGNNPRLIHPVRGCYWVVDVLLIQQTCIFGCEICIPLNENLLLHHVIIVLSLISLENVILILLIKSRGAVCHMKYDTLDLGRYGTKHQVEAYT